MKLTTIPLLSLLALVPLVRSENALAQVTSTIQTVAGASSAAEASLACQSALNTMCLGSVPTANGCPAAPPRAWLTNYAVISTTQNGGTVVVACRATCNRRANFQVQIQTCAETMNLNVPYNSYILDAAEEAGIDLPYSSRAGADGSSMGRLLSGAVDQSDQSFLNDAQIRDGYFLYDVAYPLCDLSFTICFPSEPPICPQ